MKDLKGKYLLLLIAMCGLMAGSGGLTVNVAGLFFNPISEELGIGRGDVSLGMTICNLVASFAGLAIAKVIRSDNFKRAVTIGSGVTVASTVLLGLCSSVLPMYLLHAVRGLSTGFVGMILVTMMINSWFQANNGLITSIAMGFSGLASAVFSPVLSAVIQSSGWRMTYFVSAVLIALFSVPVIVFPIGLRPEDAGTVPYGEAPERKGQPHPAKAPEPIAKDMFVLVLLYALLSGALPTVVQHLPGIASSYALPASVGAIMLSVGMIANTGGKLLLGFLIDRIGTRLSVLFSCAAVAAGIFCVMTMHSAAGMMAGAALIGLSYSIMTVGHVMMIRDVFGAANYGLVYPKTSLGVTLTYASCSTLIGFVYDLFGSYMPILYAMLALVAGTAFLVVIIYAKHAARHRN